MTKFMRFFGLSYLLLLMGACGQETLSDDPLKDFSSGMTFKLSPVQVIELEEFGVFKPEVVLKTANGYVIKNQTDKSLFSSIDLFTRRVIHGVDRGEGPNELISPSSFQKKGNDFLIYDIAKKNICKVILEDSLITISKYKHLEISERPFIISLLKTGFVASGIFSKAWMVCFDNNGHASSTLNFPLFEETNSFSEIAMSSLYVSTLTTIRPDELSMVCASQKHGVLSFCKIAKNEINEYKQLKYYPPKVSASLKEDSPTIAFSRDNKTGFCGIASDENHVFVLYSGRTYNSHGTLCSHCEHILVYNWEGDPVTHYVLEKPLYSMNYDTRTKTIYGVGYDPEGVILEYKLQ